FRRWMPDQADDGIDDRRPGEDERGDVERLAAVLDRKDDAQRPRRPGDAAERGERQSAAIEIAVLGLEVERFAAGYVELQGDERNDDGGDEVGDADAQERAHGAGAGSAAAHGR